jgi:hypothetical protein
VIKKPGDDLIVKDAVTGRRIPNVYDADSDTGTYRTHKMRQQYVLGGIAEIPEYDDLGRPKLETHNAPIRINKVTKNGR